MQRRHLHRLFSLVLAVTLLASSVLSAAAQRLQPPDSSQPVVPSARLAPEPAQQGPQPWLQRPAGDQPDAAASPAVPVGQPGLSFRHVKTFGQTETPYLADAQHLNDPNGLFIDNDNSLYVVEESGHRLLRYNTSGANTLIVGAAGQPWHHDRFLAWPKGVTADAAGNMWVTIGHAVKAFDPAGNLLLRYPDDEPWNTGSDNNRFDLPRGIAFDSTGRLFVADDNNHRVQVFTVSGTSLTYQATIGVTGEPGSDNSHFNHPAEIAIDSSNRLYVADVENSRVQRCTFSGAWTCSTFHGTGMAGGADDQLNWAYGLGRDVAGNSIYIADSGNGRIKRCTTAGSCSILINGLAWPSDVAADSAGNVFVNVFDDFTVRKYNSAGSPMGVFAGVSGVPYVTDGQHLNGPWGVGVGPDGSVYVTENRGYRLLKLDPSGSAQWTVGEAGIYGGDNAHLGAWWTGPEGSIAIDRAGRVYVPDKPNNRIQIFNADGSYHATFGAWGVGNNEFEGPVGVAISPATGDIFVVDHGNQRIQVYTRHWVYRMTLGVLDEQGSDNRHFSWPRGVAVDASGAVYVADVSNYRVQKCLLSANDYACTTFAGETGVFGNDNGHIVPMDVAVDAAGRVYVADPWNDRVQVFDATGAYLATIGGVYSSSSGGLRDAVDVAVDKEGNVYVAERDNHRVQKFSPVVPGWKQVNVTGFGERWSFLGGLTAFGGRLYAGGAHNNAPWIWRQNAGGDWSAVVTNGLGGENYWIDHLAEFNGQLYASTGHYACDNPACSTGHTDGGQIWRSADGVNWSLVVDGGFGDAENLEIFTMTVFGGHLYATTLNTATGGEIWRSSTGNAGSWTRVVNSGFGDPGTLGAFSLQAHNGMLYVGTNNDGTGGQVWRSTDAVVWSLVNVSGFGDANTREVGSLASFGGYLYAGAYNRTTGAQLWRCSACDGSDWSQVVGDGFGGNQNRRIAALPALAGRLYAITSNFSGEGMQVWRSANGQQWQQDAPAGFGNGNNTGSYWGNSVAVFGNRLFIGTSTDGVGNQIWQKTVTADFSATPLSGRPPLAVSFSNASAGDVTSTQWDFGDGQSSAAANPAHTYGQAGAYTVRLTVSDGVDSHTLTRPAYVNAWYRNYLPLTSKNYDPLSDIYDSFDNPAFNGVWNPLLWSWAGENPFHAAQQNGALVLWNGAPSPPGGGAQLQTRQRLLRSPQQTWYIAGRMKISDDRLGGHSSVQLKVHAFVNNHGWTALCGLNGSQGNQNADFSCGILVPEGTGWRMEYQTASVSVPYNTWHVARIEIVPTTAQLRFYLNGAMIGSHVPSDAAALAVATSLSASLDLWNGDANAASTRYVDDVRMTPGR